MAVKRYDGSAWQTVAGLGQQGQAATSSSIATWVKTASGGETSMSGNDDSSQPLSYTVGQELVYINGVLQKRGDDYTATTGNSITGLTALTAGDIVSVWTVNAFSVTNAISNTIVDAKGDLLVGTAADTPGRLAVGSNDQVLTADSTTATGLKWATPAAGALTQLATGTPSGATTDFTFTMTGYKEIWVVYNALDFTTDPVEVYFRPNGITGASNYLGFHQRMQNATYSTAASGYNTNGYVSLTGGLTSNFRVQGTIKITNLYNVDGANGNYVMTYNSYFRNSTDEECVASGTFDFQSSANLTKVTFATSASTFAGGTVTVFGVK